MLNWFLVSLLVSLCACAASSPTPASAPTQPPTPSTTPPASAPADEAPTPHFRPLDLANACPHDLHLYFGDHPGDGHGEETVVATGATIPVPRGADGAVVVWVVDDKGSPLASVHVTKHMRHVRIDAACMKIDADSTR